MEEPIDVFEYNVYPAVNGAMLMYKCIDKKLAGPVMRAMIFQSHAECIDWIKDNINLQINP